MICRVCGRQVKKGDGIHEHTPEVPGKSIGVVSCDNGYAFGLEPGRDPYKYEKTSPPNKADGPKSCNTRWSDLPGWLQDISIKAERGSFAQVTMTFRLSHKEFDYPTADELMALSREMNTLLDNFIEKTYRKGDDKYESGLSVSTSEVLCERSRRGFRSRNRRTEKAGSDGDHK